MKHIIRNILGWKLWFNQHLQLIWSRLMCVSRNWPNCPGTGKKGYRAYCPITSKIWVAEIFNLVPFKAHKICFPVIYYKWWCKLQFAWKWQFCDKCPGTGLSIVPSLLWWSSRRTFRQVAHVLPCILPDVECNFS